MLKFKYPIADKDKIPEAHRALYTEANGFMVLQLEGGVDVDRLTEFRDNNIALTRERDALKATWEGLKIEDVRALMAKKSEIENSKAKTPEEVQKLIEERLTAVNSTHKAELDKIAAERDKLFGEMSVLKIGGAVTEAVTGLGALPAALPHISRAAAETMKLEDGKVVIYKDGKPAFSSKDGNPLSIKEWAEGLAKESPFFFAASQGGGAPGQQGGPKGSQANVPGYVPGTNPFKQGATFNLSVGQALFKADPDTARRLAAEAGFKALPAA